MFFVLFFSSQGHLYCVVCVQRASAVAIGDGKTHLKCLTECEAAFDLTTLQKALGKISFAKWCSKIQLADIEQVNFI
jgi:hypothetical protein